MKTHLIVVFIVASIVFTAKNVSAATDTTHLLSAGIRRAHQQHIPFQAYSLFRNTTGDKHMATLKNETLLLPDTALIQRLFTVKPEAITLFITTENGTAFQLDLLKSHPFASNATVSYMDATGTHTLDPIEEGLHYQGAIAGTEQSIAAVSIYANGEVTMLFGDATGNYNLGPLADSSGRYILYNDRDLKAARTTSCATPDLPAHEQQTETARRGTGISECNKVQLHWEIDYQQYLARGTLPNTQNYATSLFNNMQALYNNDGIAVELKSLLIYTVPDGYASGNSTAALTAFQNKWNGLLGKFGADLAHLIAKDGNGNGGIAFLNPLCYYPIAYAYSEIQNTVNAIPTYSWDVEVVTHETGHNLGSHHTHWCGWNTGAGGACGAIDNCVAKETGSGCTTCGQTATSGPGTIMSYCHLTARGINLASGFGPLPRNAIQYTVRNATCLTSIISATLTPSSICNTNDGAATLALNTNNFGVAPITYAWSNGATTQSLSGLSTPGAYTVTITDANTCANTYTATVRKGPRAGNGNAYTGTMPICCGSPGKPTLSATVPSNLSECETVGWLRTTSPIASQAAAQTAFNSAAPADKLFSTNADSMMAATGALLKITTPASCAIPVTYYYTPFISQKPKAANSITCLAASIWNADGPPVIGKYASIPDQTAMPTPCDLLYAPTTEQLVVTVSNYTGRPNHLTISLYVASTYLTVYSNDTLPGNGTYTIPLNGLKGGPLQQFILGVMDYNCPSTCIGSTVDIFVIRTVTYPAAAGTPTFETACASGTSIRMNYSALGTGCTPLPVTLLSFSGELLPQANRLSWETADEHGMQSYDPERAADGLHFTSFGSVPAGHKPQNAYSYMDRTPLPESYYRIKMTELNGKVSYSHTIKTGRSPSTTGNILLLFPNPAQRQVTIQLSAGSTEDMNVMVRNMLGQVVYERSLKAVKGMNEWNISLEGWATGIYSVSLYNRTGIIEVQKLIVE